MTVVPLVEHMDKRHGCHWEMYVNADVATAATTVVTCSPRLNQLQLPYLLCGFWPKDLPSLRAWCLSLCDCYQDSALGYVLPEGRTACSSFCWPRPVSMSSKITQLLKHAFQYICLHLRVYTCMYTYAHMYMCSCMRVHMYMLHRAFTHTGAHCAYVQVHLERLRVCEIQFRIWIQSSACQYDPRK